MPPKTARKGAGGGDAASFASPTFTKTIGAKEDPSKVTVVGVGSDGSDTPRTQDWNEQISSLEAQQIASGGKVKSWFDDEFLQRALDERLFPNPRSYPANPNPTLFVLVGPASSGKSSAKSLIPAGMIDVVNVDVDEVKLYGNSVLEKHPHDKKPGVMLSDVEGIQFKYPEVLAKLRGPVFQAAIAGGKGNYKNIILDTTGGMTDIIKTYIKTAKNTYGYAVKVIIVYSERQQCLDRVDVRNRELRGRGEETRYIPPQVIGSIYDNFLKKRLASYYALEPRMIELVDELILVDNRVAGAARIIATRRRDDGVVISQDGGGGGGAEVSLVDIPGAFYGLTIQSNPPQLVDPLYVTQAAPAPAPAPAPKKASKKAKGGSRKQRIITRRRRVSRYNKKTIKNHRRPHSHRRRR